MLLKNLRPNRKVFDQFVECKIEYHYAYSSYRSPTPGIVRNENVIDRDDNGDFRPLPLVSDPSSKPRSTSDSSVSAFVANIRSTKSTNEDTQYEFSNAVLKAVYRVDQILNGRLKCVVMPGLAVLTDRSF